MSAPQGGLTCRTDHRRHAIRAARHDGVEVNGIDEVEVDDDGRRLTITFLGPAPDGLTPANVRIDGGHRVKGIEAVDVTVERAADPELDDRLQVTLDRPGDTGQYRVSLVVVDPYGRPGSTPYPGFDQRYHTTEFRFWPQRPALIDCAAHIDCAALIHCAAPGDRHPAGPGLPGPGPGPAPAPVIDYTARDYDTVRQALLDRLAVSAPGWVEHHPADLRLTLVELLAATADQISYQQDAVATEAYLDTARRRVSVRRHARLIDYPMHDGANARAVVVLDVTEPVTLHPGSYRFAAVRSLPGQARPGVVVDDRELDDLDRRGSVQVFEPLERRPRQLHPAHGEIRFWTWGDEECVLRAGATSATLRDEWADPEHTWRALHLRPGDLLVLEERRGPRSGTPADADPRRRQAVRLTGVTPGVDELAGQPVVEVSWDAADAPAFDLCLSTRGGPRCAPIPDVSVARGNAVLVDHGRSLTHGGRPAERAAHHPPRRSPLQHTLARHPVTQAVPFPDPDVICARQAERLAGIPERVRYRLTELWRDARDADGLSDAAVAELAVLFGLPFLDGLRLRAEPVRVLRDLLHSGDRLLAAKQRRLQVLTARARAGTVLDRHLPAEIADTWGPAYATGLDPDDPALHGPVSGPTLHGPVSGLVSGPVSGLAPDPRRALPAVRVEADGHTWLARRDLLDSGPRDRHVVGEPADDGRLTLRFGDGRYGAAPPPGADLEIAYRIGGGTAGNLGAEAITHLLVCPAPDGPHRAPPPVVGVRNPLPATGGTDPEPVEQVRRLAPLDLRRRRLRAVTAEDYAALAAQVPGVARAAARLRRTGSGSEAHVAVDAYGTGTPSGALLDAVTHTLERYRRIGHDVVVEAARPVPLDVALAVCPERGHDGGRILTELHRVLGTGTLPAGGGRPGPRLGFFHPDALTFGDPVHVSRLVAAAAAVPGVHAVRVTRLRRLLGPDEGALRTGLLRLGPLEIAQCDNDPARPEAGHLAVELTVELTGGS